jgi:hypothetical protein
MEIDMQVESSVIPSEVQILQGKKLINVGVVEKTRTNEDGTTSIYYVYEQVQIQIDATDADVAKLVADTTLSNWKLSRAEAVANIKVTVNAMEFDGDEESQTRMARAITVLADGESQLWVLANNTSATVTKAEFVEALRLAGQAQTALWIYS